MFDEMFGQPDYLLVVSAYTYSLVTVKEFYSPIVKPVFK
jgi:hypothetical protein